MTSRKSFAPLPKRKTPKPWDAGAVEAYNRAMVKVGAERVQSAPVKQKPRELHWEARLSKLKIGDSILESKNRTTTSTMCCYWGQKWGWRFRTQKTLDGILITRVE